MRRNTIILIALVVLNIFIVFLPSRFDFLLFGSPLLLFGILSFLAFAFFIDLIDTATKEKRISNTFAFLIMFIFLIAYIIFSLAACLG